MSPDDFQDLFVEARLCIEDAQESQETTYFAEDLDAAQEAVDEAVAAFKARVAGDAPPSEINFMKADSRASMTKVAPTEE